MLQKTCATLIGIGLSLLCPNARNVPTRMDFYGQLWNSMPRFGGLGSGQCAGCGSGAGLVRWTKQHCEEHRILG